MAFEVYGTKGALGWNLEKLNELQLYLVEDELHTGYRTVFGGDRFPYHGHFVPGSANGIGFEDLVVIEDYEFCRAVAEGRAHRAGLRRRASTWVQRAGRAAALGASRAAGRTSCRCGRTDDGRDRTAHGADAATRRCASASSASGGSGACTPSCSRARCRAPRSRRSTTPRADGARAVGAELGVPRRRLGVDELLGAADVDAVAICSTTDTHADLIVAAARAGKAIFCEKPVSLDLAEVDRALAAVEAAGVAVPDRLQPPLRPRPRVGRARRSPTATVGEPHLVRISSRDPAPPPLEYVARLGRDLPRHDDPRLRHGPLRDRQRGRRGLRARRACASTRRSREAGDVDTAVVTLDARQRLPDRRSTTRRQAVYGYDQRVEVFGSRGHGGVREPARAHRRSCATARRHARARRCRTSSSSATSRATCASGRRSSPRSRRRDAAGHRRPTPARRSSSAWPPGARCASGGPVPRSTEVGRA